MSASESTHWSVDDAASALGRHLRRLDELEREDEKYPYERPPSIAHDMRETSRRVRDAVRFLMSPEAD